MGLMCIILSLTSVVLHFFYRHSPDIYYADRNLKMDYDKASQQYKLMNDHRSYAIAQHESKWSGLIQQLFDVKRFNEALRDDYRTRVQANSQEIARIALRDYLDKFQLKKANIPG